MAEEDKKPQLRLKTGADVDARAAYATWRMLGAVRRVHPSHFATLLALARGESDRVTDSDRQVVQREQRFYLDRDNNLKTLARDVLLSSYRDTPDGPMLVDPFLIETTAEHELIARLEREHDQQIRRFIDGDIDPPSSLSR